MEKLPERFRSERIVKLLYRVPSMKQKVDWRCLALISAQFCRKIVELSVNWSLHGLCFFKENGKISENARSVTKLKKHFIQLLCDFFGIRFWETAHLPLP